MEVGVETYLPVRSCVMTELGLFDAPRCGSGALVPGVGLQPYDFAALCFVCLVCRPFICRCLFYPGG